MPAGKRRSKPVFEMDPTRTRERALWKDGAHYVAGVDEAGVGPLAGPVVAAAVILPRDAVLDGVNDSKKLTEAKREALFREITERATAWAVAGATPAEIDKINIYHAALLAMARAVNALGLPVDHALVDGRVVPGLACPQTRIVGGDAQEPTIAAASILAKVQRDRIMAALHLEFPQYGFNRHKGYPTPVHRQALAEHGPCSLHRLSYEAVRRLVEPPALPDFDASAPGEKSPTDAESWRARLKSQERRG